MSQRKIQIPESLRQGQFTTQEEVLMVRQKKGKLFIGIPKEEVFQENRVSLVPTSVSNLVNQGHRVVIETGAGEKSNFSDHHYSEAGAEIVHSKREIYNANIIVRVAPIPLEDIEYLKPNTRLK